MCACHMYTCCVYGCLYLGMYVVDINLYVHICMSVSIHAYMFVGRHIYMHIHTNIRYTHAYKCVYASVDM